MFLTQRFVTFSAAQEGRKVQLEAAAEGYQEEGRRRWRQGQEEEVVKRKSP